MTTTTAHEQHLEIVEAAKKPSDLFPDKASAKTAYRRLARRVHPDVVPPELRDRAVDAFAKLAQLWDTLNGVARPVAFVTRRHIFTLGPRLARGDIANVYRIWDNQEPDPRLLVAKIVRHPANNELIVQEVRALKTLNSDLPERLRAFYPTTVDTFRHRDTDTAKNRQAIVLEDLVGAYTLRQVMDRYPEGLDPRDVAWMARRLWVAVANAHEVGLSHCAIVPENVMILPQDHGVILIDWAFSREMKDKLKVALPNYLADGWYGDSYDQPLDHRLDVRMAANTLEALLGARRYKPFNAFFRGCRLASTPQAEQLFQEFDELLARLYGRRRFRPFTMSEGEDNG